MLVRRIDNIKGTRDEVDAGDWVSRRLKVRRHGPGHSLHETTFRAGFERCMKYRNHQETVYCLEGEGELEDTSTGERYAITPGVVYILDENDEHILRAYEDLRLICVFSPALVGSEIHDTYNSYPLLSDDGEVLRR